METKNGRFAKHSYYNGNVRQEELNNFRLALGTDCEKEDTYLGELES